MERRLQHQGKPPLTKKPEVIFGSGSFSCRGILNDTSENGLSIRVDSGKCRIQLTGL